MPEPQVLLRNRRDQPVELHLPGGVQVLAPHAQLCVDASLLDTPQLAWLLSHKALDAAPAAPAAPPSVVPTAPPAAAARREPAARPAVPKAAPVAAAPARGKRRASQR